MEEEIILSENEKITTGDETFLQEKSVDSDALREEISKEVFTSISKALESEINSVDDIKNLLLKGKDKSEEWYKADKEKFLNENKNLSANDLDKLLSDKDFEIYSHGKMGNIPLTEIYDGYKIFLERIDAVAKEKAEKMYLKQISSPGSLYSSSNTSNYSWNSMSEQEFEKAIQNAKRGFYSNKN